MTNLIFTFRSCLMKVPTTLCFVFVFFICTLLNIADSIKENNVETRSKLLIKILAKRICNHRVLA